MIGRAFSFTVCLFLRGAFHPMLTQTSSFQRRKEFISFQRHSLIKSVDACLLLLLLSQSVDFLLIKVFEILLRYFPELLILLEQKVVRCGHVIVLIGIDASHSVLLLEVVID